MELPDKPYSFRIGEATKKAFLYLRDRFGPNVSDAEIARHSIEAKAISLGLSDAEEQPKKVILSCSEKLKVGYPLTQSEMALIAELQKAFYRRRKQRSRNEKVVASLKAFQYALAHLISDPHKDYFKSNLVGRGDTLEEAIQNTITIFENPGFPGDQESPVDCLATLLRDYRLKNIRALNESTRDFFSTILSVATRELVLREPNREPVRLPKLEKEYPFELQKNYEYENDSDPITVIVMSAVQQMATLRLGFEFDSRHVRFGTNDYLDTTDLIRALEQPGTRFGRYMVIHDISNTAWLEVSAVSITTTKTDLAELLTIIMRALQEEPTASRVELLKLCYGDP